MTHNWIYNTHAETWDNCFYGFISETLQFFFFVVRYDSKLRCLLKISTTIILKHVKLFSYKVQLICPACPLKLAENINIMSVAKNVFIYSIRIVWFYYEISIKTIFNFTMLHLYVQIVFEPVLRNNK